MGMYLGFEALADIYKFSGWELTMRQFGFNEHYTSVSRGVLDGRDLGYFIGVVLLFLSGTLIVLSRRHLQTTRTKTAYFAGALLVILISQSVRLELI